MKLSFSISKKVPKRISPFFIALVNIKGVKVRKSGKEFDLLEERILKGIRKELSLKTLRLNPTIICYRDLLWRLDIDPTKTRPSSEALLRRILRQKVTLPRINSVVDACNLASVETYISMGVYDLDKIKGNLTLRFANKDEAFFGIGGILRKLTGKELVVSDEEKIIHLYPCKDSEESAISLETENVLLIADGAPGIDTAYLKEAIGLARKYILRFSGGKPSQVKVIEIS